jgi:hypothetical protein
MNPQPQLADGPKDRLRDDGARPGDRPSLAVTAPRPVDDTPPPMGTALTIAGIAGAVAIAGVFIQPTHGFAGLLVAGLFGVFIALGAVFFIAINGAVGARWWAPLRRPALSLGRGLPAPMVLVLAAVLLGLYELYPWTDAEVAQGYVVSKKLAWLNTPHFIARAVLVCLAWLATVGMVGRAIEGVRSQATAAERSQLTRASIGALVLLAISLSVAGWDWLLSLEPEWWNTMQAVYLFSGSFVGGIAALAVVVLSGVGPAKGMAADPKVRHDLGKLLFAFATFYGYIWFCQFMLVWYVHLPDETTFYAIRMFGAWAPLFWLQPILTFVVPFVVLMSARAKRHPTTLLQVSVVVLLGRWLDAWLLVGPTTGQPPVVPVVAIAGTIASVAVMALLFTWSMKERSQ